MIFDSHTNKVYFSNLSKYDFKDELTKLLKVLKDYTIDWGFIKGTKDYFCRDYMPVQVNDNHFVQFQFHPDYLLKSERKKYLTDIQQIYKKNEFLNDFDITFSNITLDGGNIVKSKDNVIITDKIFVDNRDRTETEIINELETLLDCNVIIIPAYPGEETGHADGLVRFIDEKTVLTYNLEIENDDITRKWREDFLRIFASNNIEVVMLPAISKEEDEINWAYLNFLQVKDVIILPVFNRKSDEIVIDFLNKIFNINIETVYAQRIYDKGGVLNCFTWTILIHNK